MTKILPILPSDLTKAPTKDLVNYLNTRLLERQEEGNSDYEELLTDITTELFRRGELSGEGKSDKE